MRGWAIAALLTSACGNVVFVDPDAALEASLILDAADRIVIDGDDRTYFHVRVGGREGIDLIRLVATGPDGSVAVPLSGAHTQPCGLDQTCISVTMGPGVPDSATDMVLEAPSIGHRHTRRLTIRSGTAYVVLAEPLARNETVRVSVQDPIRAIYPGSELVDGGPATTVLFPRSFEALVAPGACGPPIGATDDRWTKLTTLPFTVTATFSAGVDPAACVAVRPAQPLGGGAVAQRTAVAGAIVTRFVHTYTPPTENSPLVFLPIFNLELPSEARCVEAQTLVRSAILDAATNIASDVTEGAEVLALPALELAERDLVPCRQEQNPRLDRDVIFGQIRADLQDAFGLRRRVRVVFIYVTNLQVDMPPNLAGDIDDLREKFRNQTFIRDYLIAISPERAAPVGAEQTIPWVATEEPTFRDSIRIVLGMSWPFKTAIHNSTTVIPLVDDGDETRYEFFRVCSSIPQASLPLGTLQQGSNAFIPPPNGPAYRMRLEDKTLVPSQIFSTPTVEVDWEGCEGLCNRPAPQSNSGFGWLMSGGCG